MHHEGFHAEPEVDQLAIGRSAGTDIGDAAIRRGASLHDRRAAVVVNAADIGRRPVEAVRSGLEIEIGRSTQLRDGARLPVIIGKLAASNAGDTKMPL